MASSWNLRRNVPLVVGVLLLLISVLATAGNARSQRKLVEMSMLVTGELVIAADGSVSDLQLDQRDKLPPGVQKLVDQARTEWLFEPFVIDGVARKVRSRMSLHVVAKEMDSGDYSIGLRSAYFGKAAHAPADSQDTSSLRSKELTPPIFPHDAGRVGGRGIVYLLLRIQGDGTVSDAVAEQVNLQVLGDDATMKALRKTFSNAALRASKQWTFQVPTTGEEADDGHWAVRVPVSFQYEGHQAPGYGEWEAYVPGPRKQAPWADSDEGSPEALIAGGIYPLGQELKLRTPLQSI